MLFQVQVKSCTNVPVKFARMTSSELMSSINIYPWIQISWWRISWKRIRVEYVSNFVSNCQRVLDFLLILICGGNGTSNLRLLLLKEKDELVLMLECILHGFLTLLELNNNIASCIHTYPRKQLIARITWFFQTWFLCCLSFTTMYILYTLLPDVGRNVQKFCFLEIFISNAKKLPWLRNSIKAPIKLKPIHCVSIWAALQARKAKLLCLIFEGKI